MGERIVDALKAAYASMPDPTEAGLAEINEALKDGGPFLYGLVHLAPGGPPLSFMEYRELTRLHCTPEGRAELARRGR